MSDVKNQGRAATAKIEDFLSSDIQKKLLKIKRDKEIEISKKREDKK